MFKLIALISLLIISCQNNNSISKNDFSILLNTVSEGWNNGNAQKAADCFTENAVYIEPPDRQLYISRDSLFQFFGGEEGRSNPMKMTWHYVLFDEDKQIGAAEYTFAYKGRSTHGIVIIKIWNGKIDRWREYQYRSYVDWKTFIGKSMF